MNIPIFVETAAAIVKTMNNRLHEWYKGSRPNISDKGAITIKSATFPAQKHDTNLPSGPKLNPRTYTDTINPDNISFVDPKSRITSGTPGANMELASGVRKVMAEINSTVPHFFVKPQFSGC